MGKIKYFTSGESHGPALTTIVRGLPAGFEINTSEINKQLARRQCGYGRGGRMKIEKDKVTLLGGCRGSKSLGSPLSMMIPNRDYENWISIMHPVKKQDNAKVHIPRPGHADYAGTLKYAFDDIRNVLERASARETAARILPGAVCRQILDEFGIRIYSHVVQIGLARCGASKSPDEEILKKADDSDVRCLDKEAADAMRREIDDAKFKGDSLGGIFRVCVFGLPVGLGSYVHWDEKLTSMISAEIMGIQAIRGIEFGLGFDGAAVPGSRYHDDFQIIDDKITRGSNHAGGLEGGMSNGCVIEFRAVMKSIPTLTKPLSSFRMDTMKKADAHKERTDSCAVPAASVVAENVTAVPVLSAILDRFGGDCRKDILERYYS